jgi:hypothetical protein
MVLALVRWKERERLRQRPGVAARGAQVALRYRAGDWLPPTPEQLLRAELGFTVASVTYTRER